ncbi:MarR family transcriptional regulator [bacterium]|nr:MarR family transcriptional regulator [bacterium]
MSLHDEIGLLKPFKSQGHETLLTVILTASLLVKEGQQLLRPYGLTEAQFNVLLLLKDQSENGMLNQTKLGSMLLVNRSNITGLIDRMEQAGMVKRIPDGDDRRVNLVQMTDEGRQLLANAEKIYFKRVNEITSVLSSNEFVHLTKILERIRKQLHYTQE